MVACAIFATTRPHPDRPSFGTGLPKWNVMSQFRFGRRIDNNSSTSFTNLLRIYDVGMCTADVDYFSRVSLATFATAWYC